MIHISVNVYYILPLFANDLRTHTHFNYVFCFCQLSNIQQRTHVSQHPKKKTRLATNRKTLRKKKIINVHLSGS